MQISVVSMKTNMEIPQKKKKWVESGARDSSL
jgi:hypothetical protein